MSLMLILLVPLVGGVLCLTLARDDASRARRIAHAALALDLLVLLWIWLQSGPLWFYEMRAPWIPHFGASLSLVVDGLSLLMLLLTVSLGMVAVAASRYDAPERPGLYYFALLSMLAGIAGVFLAGDLLLFFVFYEVMLIPAYFLIALWGDPRMDRNTVATRFFMFTQAGSLLMLLSILGIYFVHGAATNDYTFAYGALLNTPMPLRVGLFLMLGFFIGFAVKLPVVPLHGWQPDTYATLPTGVGIVLSGLMAKAGAYGLLRFVVPLFPDAAHGFAPWAMSLAVVSILYGAFAAYSQRDLRRFIAYSGISHLGFVVLGAFSGNAWGYSGAVIQMLSHGLSAAGLFLLAALLESRASTRDLSVLGGLWRSAPRLGGFGLILVLATLGLPGMLSFVGEFLVLLGAFQVSPLHATLAAIGTVFATAYSLRIMQKIFFGPETVSGPVADLKGWPAVPALALSLALVGFGLFPQPLLNLADSYGSTLRATAAAPSAGSPVPMLATPTLRSRAPQGDAR
ncbi:MAG: NADH-quinone oxidoreductase subunit M [FCB group bacterium]|jgi:NADH-quinone oxidoreductase subunit M|nr:NADH-quinone oxidoreductase subunit M [FCB group bacterium]